MDASTLSHRLGKQVREKRLNRGMTQADLARIAGMPRQKIISIERGELTVAMSAYARAVAALDCELTVVPAAMPTLDEVQSLFE